MSLDKPLEDAIHVFQNVSGFCETDQALLAEGGKILLPHIPGITDAFYEQLMSEPATAAYIEGRVDYLKGKHIHWLEGLFTGKFDEEFIQNQLRIGRAHVDAKVPPLFVASSMGYLRAAFPAVISKEAGDADADKLSSAILRILDICQYLIDYAYEQDRLDRLTEATGLSRVLLENLIALKKKD